MVGSAPPGSDDRFRRVVSNRVPDRERSCGHHAGTHVLRCRLRFSSACRNGVDAASITYLYQLRIFTRHLRAAGVVSIADIDVARLPGHVRRLAQELQDALSRGSTAEAEQHKDVWDMGVFGHGRKRLDFTVIVPAMASRRGQTVGARGAAAAEGTQRRRCAA